MSEKTTAAQEKKAETPGPKEFGKQGDEAKDRPTPPPTAILSKPPWETSKTIYITEHALKQGILSRAATVRGDFASYQIMEVIGKPYTVCLAKPDFHETREAALKDCQRRKVEAIVKHRAAIRHLDAMKFERRE